MGAQRKRAAITSGLAFALFMGGVAIASPDQRVDVDVKQTPSEEQVAAAACGNVPTTLGLMPQNCIKAGPSAAPEATLAPTATQGPILLQEVSTNTVRSSSVAGIATLTSFGALVPTSAVDFPADFIRLLNDTERVYSITGGGQVSRYTSTGANTALAPIPPPAGLTWSDTATDPTTGTVYAVALNATLGTSSLFTINVLAGTSASVGPITGGGFIISLAADNLGNLFGIDITGTADRLIAVNKLTGVGTNVGAIGFDSNFGQAFDCDPASGICYMFTINVTAANARQLRTVDTATGATVSVGTIGTTSPGAATQVAGAVFKSITDVCTVNGDCFDPNLCNGTETCVANVCTAGTPVNCNDGLFCTTDTCTPLTGTCNHPANPCGDGDACTADTCDEATDTCGHTNAALTFCNAASIAIPASGAGTPYPSPIAISGLGTSASVCSVKLLGLTHTFPDDIDVLLVGPVATTQNATIMSDVGGSLDIVGVNLNLQDTAASSLPDATILTTGTFKPTNIGATSDAFPAPAPAQNLSSSLSVFNGNPNGTWNLYVSDQFTPDSGSMSGGWCVSVIVAGCSINADCNDGNLCNGTETCVANSCQPGTPLNCDDSLFCTLDSCDPPTGNCGHAPRTCNDSNACTADSCDEGGDVCVNTNTCVQVCNNAVIDILDSVTPPTAADPYPAVINVSAGPGVFTLVSVEILGLSHTFPDDIDMLLTAPNTVANAIIMSDVGGGTDAVAANLTLTDGAPAIPDGGPVVTGTFAPTNVNPGTGTETYPAPAPLPSGLSPLSQFNGTNPNGDWNLYVVDDEGTDAGSIANGWCLNYKLTCTTAGDCDDADPCTTDLCVSSACTHSAIGTPALVTNVTSDPDKQTISWAATANATRYDVVSGLLSALPVGPGGGDETPFCNLATPTVVDGTVPAPSTGLWYIIRGDNDCAAGSYGTQSNGSPRITTTCP